MNVVPTDE